MTFLTGSLLFGLLAAAIPVVIHLLHRQRTVPVPWGAMQFLLESQLRFKRRKKVDHWLLLLARVALLALLAFLLARPLLTEGKYNPLSPDVATDIAVVVDHSLSAGRRAAGGAGSGAGNGAGGGAPTGAAGEQSVFQRGLDVVDEVARRMRPNDTIGVVLAEQRPDASLTPLPVRSGEMKDVSAKLRRLRPGMTRASIPDAVQAARELARRGPNTQKVVIVVSDEQRQSWQAEDNAAWRAALGERSGAGAAGGLHVFALPVAPEAGRADVAVGEVNIEPGLVGVKRPAQITATLTTTGPPDADLAPLAASLVVNGKEVGRQTVAGLKVGQARTVRFDHSFAEAGSNWVKVQVDARDALAEDNAAVAAAEVWQRLAVLVIDGQLTSAGSFRSSQFLVAAMQPVAEASQEGAALVQPKVISASAAEGEKFEDYAAVVVNDVPQLSDAATEKLAAYARAGGGVWLILGARTEASFVTRDLAGARLVTLDLAKRQATGAPPGVELRAPQNPMVALLAAAERNAMTGAVVRQWWSAAPKDGDEQVVLAAAGGGEALVFERPVGRGGGRVVVWCTSADGAWNNWPLMPNFVPLVNETVYHLASARTKSSASRHLDAGAPLEWTGPAEPRVKSASVTRPDGKVVQKQPSLTNGRQRLSYNDTAEPGLYTLRFDPTEVPQPVYFGVGIDRRELDNAPLTDADHAWLQSRGFVERRVGPAELATALGGAGEGVELWKWLGVGVLGLLVFETVMTRRMVRLQEGRADVAGTAAVGVHA
jgi:hypothetical protein